MRVRLREWLQQADVRTLALTSVMWVLAVGVAGVISAVMTKLVDMIW